MAFAREWLVFLSHPRDMRVLILANMVFSLVSPVLDVFVAAYVLRNSHDASKVMMFQLAIYTAIPFAFFVTGCLLGRIGLRYLYPLGMLITGLSIMLVMAMRNITPWTILACGLFMGLAFGLFAACRTMLALTNTTDSNRNYYYGVEMFAYTLTSVLIPLAVGWLLQTTPGHGWFGGTRNSAYQVVAACALALTFVSAAIILQGRFRHVGHSRFIYFQFHPLWRKMLGLAVLKGLAQGYIVTIPAMLILTLVGQEGILGSLVSVGGVISALAMYCIGRLSRPRHRLAVFAAGLVVFLAGGVVDSLWFNAAGALVLSLCLLTSKPLLDVAYFPIQLQVTNALAARESRGDFSYLFSHECAEYVGRLIGCGLFLALALWISASFALRYALLAIGAVQLLSLAVARDLLERLGRDAASIATERVPAPE